MYRVHNELSTTHADAGHIDRTCTDGAGIGLVKPSEKLRSICGRGKPLSPTALGKLIEEMSEYKDGRDQVLRWKGPTGRGFDGDSADARYNRKLAARAVGEPEDYFEDDSSPAPAPDVAEAADDAHGWQAGVHRYVMADERGRNTPGPVVIKLLELPPETRRSMGYRSGVPDDIHSARQTVEGRMRELGELPIVDDQVGPRLDPAWTAALERSFSEHGFPSPQAVTMLYATSTEGVTDIDATVVRSRERAVAQTGGSRDSRPAGRPGKAAAKRRRR